MERPGYREILLGELTERKARNPLYSIRAFARDLGVGVTTLSDVLASRRHLSPTNLEKIATRIQLSPTELAASRREIRHQAGPPAGPEAELRLQEDAFRLISDWYYFALLSLARLPQSRADAVWIARRLGISPLEARDALQRLQRLGYIATDGVRLRRTASPIRTTENVPSAAIRHHHRQNLRRAEAALDGVEVSRREISSVTLACDRRQLAAAKRMIAEFKGAFEKRFAHRRPNEVYTLGVQFFPATAERPRRPRPTKET